MPAGSRSARADIGETLTTSAFGAIAGAAATLFAARALGPSRQGELQVVMSLGTTCGQLFAGGVSMSLIQMIAAARAPGREATTAGALVASYSVAGCVVAAALAPVVAPELLPEVGSGEFYVFLAAVLGSLYAVQTTLLAAARATNDFRSFNRATLAGRLLAALFIVMALAIGAPRVGDAIAALITANIACVAIGVVVAHRSGSLAGPPDTTLLRPLVLGNGAAYLGTLAQELAYRGDVVLLAALSTTREVGLYAIPLLLAELLWYLPNAAGLVVFTRSARANTSDFTFTASVSAASFVLVTPLAVLVGAASVIIVPALLSDDYQGAVAPILLMMPGAIALAIWKVLINDLVARGRPRSKLQSALVGAIVMLALDLLLIPRYGAAGAATASSLGYACSAAISLRQIVHMSSLRVSSFLIPDTRTRDALWRAARDPRELLRTATGRASR